MAQLIVRNLEDDVKERLQRRAKRLGRSLEEEVREILRNEVRHEEMSLPPLGSRLSRRFLDIGLDGDIVELREQPAQPAAFEG
jgi:plasmid stability protein